MSPTSADRPSRRPDRGAGGASRMFDMASEHAENNLAVKLQDLIRDCADFDEFKRKVLNEVPSRQQ